MTGTFVVSLDLELMWGVRDKRTVESYGDAVRGEREAIPGMLARFAANDLRATWATVGIVFARDRSSLMARLPEIRPAYRDARLSPYEIIANGIGESEADDPLHYGHDLVEQIAATPGQEIATHTFSHYYCLEPGQTLEAFDADLAAALSIAGDRGVTPRSIVFPRNQMTPQHIQVALDQGIDCYRGNPGTFAYRSRSGAENSYLVRGVRLLDSVLPIDGSHGYRLRQVESGPYNIPASRFLRPFTPGAPAFFEFHLRRVLGEMTHAARNGLMYHLWWHPHNFGRNTGANLAGLDRVLAHFRTLQAQYGMTSANMGDLAERRLSAIAT